jgi:predicted DNA-binding protein (MmcQ/YjbR family)
MSSAWPGSVAVTRDELTARALAFPAAQEDYPFGDDLLTVKVGGRVFAWIPLGETGWLGRGARVAVKLPPDLVAELRDAYPDQVSSARPLDERYWLAVRVGTSMPESEMAELLAMSYDEVVQHLPRRHRPN